MQKEINYDLKTTQEILAIILCNKICAKYTIILYYICATLHLHNMTTYAII